MTEITGVKSPVRRTGGGLPFWVMSMLVIGLLCIGVCRMRRAPHPIQLPEALRSELALRDGRLYWGPQTNPFTGIMLDYYQTNQLQSRSMISNGVLHGWSEGWYTNAQLEIRENYQQGVSHGLRTKYYPNGQRMSEGNIVNGKHEGIFRRWYEDGVLSEEIQMRNGKPDGMSRSFYPSGFPKAQVRMTNDQPVDQQSWKDGEKKADQTGN